MESSSYNGGTMVVDTLQVLPSYEWYVPYEAFCTYCTVRRTAQLVSSVPIDACPLSVHCASSANFQYAYYGMMLQYHVTVLNN